MLGKHCEHVWIPAVAGSVKLFLNLEAAIKGSGDRSRGFGWRPVFLWHRRRRRQGDRRGPEGQPEFH
jgi:hypothetical protein